MLDISIEDNRGIPVYLFIFFLSVYLLTASEPFGFTDVGISRIEVLKSIVDRFDLSIPTGMGIKGFDGREYSIFAIGSVILAIPFYITGKLIGLSPFDLVAIMNQLAGASTVVLVFLFSFSLGYSRRASLYASILYGLGTMAWFYSKDPGDHALETFFVLLSVYLMCRYYTERKDSYFIFSTLALGFAFITRPTSLLIIPALLILIIKPFYYPKRLNIKNSLKLMGRKIILFSIAFLPFLVLTFWYNYYRFGSIFETGHSLMGARLGLDFFTGTPFLTGISGFLISPGKGFFYYSPVAVLFFLSIKSFIKTNFIPGLSFIFIMIGYLFFMSKNVYWHGDWAWGPRYLFVITPYLIIPTVELFDSEIWKEKNYLKYFTILLFTLSFSIQIASVSVCSYKYFFSLQFDKNVKFTVADGDGVKPIVEPPPETYFDWSKSPILAQFKYIFEIKEKIKGYKYRELPKNAMLIDRIKIAPWFNLFDFWWFYRYILEERCAGFIVAMFMSLLAVFSFSRLWKASR
jgi:hypothetical protein